MCNYDLKTTKNNSKTSIIVSITTIIKLNNCVKKQNILTRKNNKQTINVNQDYCLHDFHI